MSGPDTRFVGNHSIHTTQQNWKKAFRLRFACMRHCKSEKKVAQPLYQCRTEEWHDTLGELVKHMPLTKTTIVVQVRGLEEICTDVANTTKKEKEIKREKNQEER